MSPRFRTWVTESWTRQTSLLGRRSSSFPSAKTVRARGQGAIRLGHDAFEHREVDLVQILDVQASHASGVRAQLLELLVISANAIGEIDAGGGLARCESGSRSIALAAFLLMIN